MQIEANQNGENKTLGLVLLGLCAFYFLCVLGIFVLPFDVLARSSLARDFVEAMLKIYPAVERELLLIPILLKRPRFISRIWGLSSSSRLSVSSRLACCAAVKRIKLA